MSQRKGRAPGPFHKAILLLPSWEGSELGLLHADGFVESCEIVYTKSERVQKREKNVLESWIGLISLTLITKNMAGVI